MCGIFGWITTQSDTMENDKLHRCINKLFLLSETRGKEASGICVREKGNITVYKENFRARKFIHTAAFKSLLERIDGNNSFVMGHARMVTNGTASIAENNQPVVKNDLVCIHNGIIVNEIDIWNKYPQMEREYEVDTEVLLSLLHKNGYDKDLAEAFQRSLDDIKGSVSLALIDKSSDYLLLYTNVGSLYYLISEKQGQMIFASERYILEKLIESERLQKIFKIGKIRQLHPRRGMIVHLPDIKVKDFGYGKNSTIEKIPKGEAKVTLRMIPSSKTLMKPQKSSHTENLEELKRLLVIDENKIKQLKRCTRCLLPESFPGIHFDKQGVCSICNSYTKNKVRGKKELQKLLNKSKTKDANYDCIVPLSGGRDSCYLLHYIVKELGLKPIAYTYDWGMVTDLARRNIQRMCSELEVEHILISADIKRKRNNVRMNVEAWLKQPDLATVPLFMAGDKQFFYYAQLLKKQMKVKNIIFGMNRLEETRFKAAFAGANKEAQDNNRNFYNISYWNKIKMLLYYAKAFIKNPTYINSSLIDSLYGFFSYYLLPQNYIQLFDYIPWNQKEIEDIILERYGWERAEDTDETWRIGDGTAAFYNYIYYKMAGFTEFDTFMSNQIREGMMSRDEAMSKIYESNRPRPDTFLWYCETIGINPIYAAQTINKQKKRY